MRRLLTIVVLAGVLVAAAGRPAVGAGAEPHTGGPSYLYTPYKADPFIRFDVPAATQSTTALCVTSAGYVIGKYSSGTAPTGPNAQEHGFIRSPDGRFRDLDLPGIRATTPWRVNDRGQVTGVYSNVTGRVGDDPRRRGFLRDGDRITWLDVMGARYTQPTGLNNRTQVVGEYQDDDANGQYHAFIWQAGRFTTIDPPDAILASAADINDTGQIVGAYIHRDEPTRLRGFLRTPDGRYSTFVVPDAGLTLPFGINNRGQIVGYTAPGLDLTGARSFVLWRGASGPLSFLTVPGSVRSGAGDINDAGQIVGIYQPTANQGEISNWSSVVAMMKLMST